MPRRNPRTDPRPGDATDGATVLTLRRPQAPALPGTDVEDGYHPSLDVDLIDPNPSNVRRDLGDLDELAASIAAVGVRHPVTVTPITTGAVTTTSTETAHRYVLVDGHRRYAAARAAGLTTVPAIVRTDLHSDVDVLTEMLRAGILQERLSPIEEATAYAQLELLGLPRAEIARRVGRSRTTVEQRLHLMDLPEAVRERVHDRAITLDEAAALAEFTDHAVGWKRGKDWLKKLEQAVGTRDWAYTLQSAKNAWSKELEVRELTDLAVQLGYRKATPSDLDDRHVWSLQLSELTAPVPEVEGDTWHKRYRRRASAHAGCPGAAYSVDQHSGVLFLCLQPELHAAAHPPVEPADTVVDEQLGGRRAVPYVESDPFVIHAALLRDWTAHEEASCAAAAAARQEWLREVLLPARKPFSAHQAAALAAFVAEQLASFVLEVQPRQWLPWLGVDIDDDGDDEEERLIAALRAARDPQRALLAGLASEQEQPSTAGAAKAWMAKTGPRSEVRAWLQLLQALGYEPCSWEAEYLAEPTGTCRVCGCTEDAACTDDPLSACWWVVPDLCSSCARKALTTAQEEAAGEDG